jgi:MFS family permease
MGSVFAMGWAEVMVVLQPLLVHYGATNTQIGIVQGVLIASLPGMLISPWITRRFRRKKIYMLVADALYLLPLVIIGAVVWAGGLGDHGTMVGFIVLMMLLGQIAAGFGGLPHQEFFTACIPMRLRGRLAGISAGLGGALGMAAAGIAAWVLSVLPEPQGFGALLVLAWFLCQLANASPLFAKEPPTPVEKSPAPWGREMWFAFFQDKSFLRVAVVICLLSPLIGQLAVFSSVFAFRELEFEAKMAAKLAFTASICRLALSPMAGWFTDAWGARRALTFWTGVAGMGFALLFIHPGQFTVFAAAGIAAVAGSGFSGAMNALTSGIPRPENRAGHFTLLGFCMIASNSAGPLLVGWMFDTVDYRSGFGILAALVLGLTLAAIWILRDLSSRHEDFA